MSGLPSRELPHCVASPCTEELVFEVITDLVDMHEVAVATPLARALVELFATPLAEVLHRRELNGEHATSVETALQSIEGSLCTVLVFELDINSAVQVHTKVVAHVHILHATEVRELGMDIVEEVFQVLLECLLCHCFWWRGEALHLVDLEGIEVHVRDGDRLAYCGSGMLPAAPVSMSACTYFVVERAVVPVEGLSSAHQPKS